uniref:RNA-binding protein EIF1AD n=1 Tax=Glossina palpalis gambiensis TaxID=67801 RepID=A0A1B0C1T7_9MUSC
MNALQISLPANRENSDDLGTQPAKYVKIKEMIQDPKEANKYRGNNFHEKPIRKLRIFWVKRDDFILVEPIEEDDKANAEICKILTTEHIKEYIKAGIWPECFKRDNTVPNGRCASNYVKESCDENIEDFKEKFSEPCHLSSNRNRPSLLAAFEGESTSSEDDS